MVIEIHLGWSLRYEWHLFWHYRWFVVCRCWRLRRAMFRLMYVIDWITYDWANLANHRSMRHNSKGWNVSMYGTSIGQPTSNKIRTLLRFHFSWVASDRLPKYMILHWVCSAVSWQIQPEYTYTVQTCHRPCTRWKNRYRWHWATYWNEVEYTMYCTRNPKRSLLIYHIHTIIPLSCHAFPTVRYSDTNQVVYPF